MRLLRTLALRSHRPRPSLPHHDHQPLTPLLSSFHQSRPFSTPSPSRKSTDSDTKSSLLDREAINTESNEYSKTGSDDGAASQEDPAFNPAKTDPEEELGSIGPGKDGLDPLEVSPANPDVSQPMDEKEGGAEKGEERKKASGGGRGRVKGSKVE